MLTSHGPRYAGELLLSIRRPMRSGGDDSTYSSIENALRMIPKSVLAASAKMLNVSMVAPLLVNYSSSTENALWTIPNTTVTASATRMLNVSMVVYLLRDCTRLALPHMCHSMHKSHIDGCPHDTPCQHSDNQCHHCSSPPSDFLSPIKWPVVPGASLIPGSAEGADVSDCLNFH